MSSLHRVRVCAVGTENDMIRLCCVLLDNVSELPSQEDRGPFKLDELIQLIQDYTRDNASPLETFLYNMISGIRYGEAEPGTCRLDIRQEPCGLWTACFAYDSPDAFQVHEWLDLHKRCGGLLMVAQHAAWDFAMDKGELILTGGHVMEIWDYMNECWLWLIPQYECGYPMEEAVARLDSLAKTLEREEADVTIAELLENCRDHLADVALSVADGNNLAADMADCVQRRDFRGLLECQHLVAESVLWETEHNAKWLACLESVLEAWNKHLAEA